MTSQTVTPKCGRLRADFIERVKVRTLEFPKRETLSSAGINAHVRTAMLEGEVLEWHYFQRLLLCLRRFKPRQVEGWTVEHLAELSEGPPVDSLMPDLIYQGWGDIIRFFGKATRIDPLSFCDADRTEDFEEMAELILDSLGWLYFSSRGEQKKAAADTARAKGEELSGVSYETWVSWLRGLCREEMRTVMFAVENIPYKGRRDNRRLGSAIQLPLKEATWHGFRAGQIGYSKLTGDDIQRPSNYILLHSLSEVRPSERPSGRKVSFAQVRIILYQLSTFCPAFSPKRPETWPSILCLAPLHVHQERAPAFGFKNTGALEPDTKTTIWELLPPQRLFKPGLASGLASYGAMLAALAFFQFAHREEVLASSG